MKVHNILTSVLIVGMFNFNVVLGQNQVVRTLLEVSHNFGIVDARSLNYYVYEFKHLVRLVCANNNRSWPEEVAAAGKKNATDCIKSVTNLTQHYAHWSWLLNDTAKVNTYVDTYCPKINSLRACVTEFTKSGQHCLTPADREVNNNVEDIIFSSLGFACENNGKRLKDLVPGRSTECIIFTKRDLMACRRPPKFNEDVLWSNFSGNLTTEQYAELQKYQRCNVDVLKTCHNQAAANYVNDLANYWLALRPRPSV